MERTRIQNMALAALFAALTAAGAFVRLPLGITSVTLQFWFTALAGVLLGPKWGAVSQGVYVGLGLLGLPVFTLGGGPGYLLQPSMGFLLGLIPAAWVIGRLADGGRRPGRTALACLAGLAVLYAAALPYMGAVLRLYLHRDMGLAALLWTGMAVYLPGDLVKIAAAALISPVLVRRLDRTG